ncbi:MAG: YbbR-like domain-containing protein [Deltaproteobacteria bacterium]|nr:YbbR-like domain-containing protein [Deltaproteobacteria bacterium]
MKKRCLFFILIILSAFLFGGCENKTVVIYAPIEIKNLPKEFIISEIQPKEIELKVTGYKSALNNLSLFKILYKIDLSDAKEGVILLQTTEDAVELPPNISIVEMTPPEISIKTEKPVYPHL